MEDQPKKRKPDVTDTRFVRYFLAMLIIFAAVFLLPGCAGDESDNSETAAAVSDTYPPMVMSIVPDNNSMDIMVESKIHVHFNETMDSNSFNSASFSVREKNNTSAIVSGRIYCSGDDVTFDPTDSLKRNTTYEVLISGKVRDAGGKEMGTDYRSVFQTSVRPFVQSTDPSMDAVGVSPKESIEIEFSEPMSAGSINTNTIKVESNSVSFPGVVTYNNNRAYFTHTNDFSENTTYSVTVSQTIEDLSGNRLESNYSWNFTTLNMNPDKTEGYATTSRNTELISGIWYNHGSPYFEWQRISHGSVNPDGYYVYFGTNPNADPVTDGGYNTASAFQTDTDLVSNSTYYLLIRTKDVNGKIADSVYQGFVYRYDSREPTGDNFQFTINSGDTYTDSRSVSLSIAASDNETSVSQMRISEDNGFIDTGWESYSTTRQFFLSGGDGPKTVYIQFKDAAGNTSAVISDVILLDTSAPTRPSIIYSFFSSDQERFIHSGIANHAANPHFKWDEPSDDSSISGYYVYWGTNPTADPVTYGWYQTSNQFTVNTLLASGSDYYLRVKSKDNAGNISTTAFEAFTHAFISIEPENPYLLYGYSSPLKESIVISERWYNHPDPQFQWDANSSDTAGYWVYWGTSAAPNPVTNGSYQTERVFTPDSSMDSGETYYLRIVTEDIYGNRSDEVPSEFIYKYDSTPPLNPAQAELFTTESGSAALDQENWYNHDSPYFVSEPGTDSDSGIEGYYLYFGTDPSADINGGDLQTNRVFDELADLESLGSGQYYLRVKTRDEAGNVSSSATTAGIYKYDSEAPDNPQTIDAWDSETESAALQSGNWYNYISPYFTLRDVSDDHSGIAGFYLYFGEDASADPVLHTYQTSPDFTGSRSFEPGHAYHLLVKTKDMAGNISSETLNAFTYRFDNRAPEGSLIINRGDAYANNRTVNLKIHISSGNSAVDQLIISETADFSGAVWDVCSFDATGDCQKTYQLSSGDGSKTVYAKVRNSLGIESAVLNDTIVLDSGAPSGPDIANGYASSSRNIFLQTGLVYPYPNPYFEWNPAFDQYTGIDKYMIYFGTDPSGTPVQESTSDSYTVTESLSDGLTYYLRIKAVDRAGNESAVNDMFIYRYDTSSDTGMAASISINDGNQYTNDRSVRVHSYTVTGDEMIISERSDFQGAAWMAYEASSDFLLSSGDGVKTVYAKFRDSTADELGPVNDFIILDTTPPSDPTETVGFASLEKNSPIASDHWYNYPNPHFQWNGASDNLSGLSGYLMYFGSDASGDPVAETTSDSYTQVSDLSADGIYYLRLKVRDLAGNVSQEPVQSFVYKYDTEPPSVGGDTLTWGAETTPFPSGTAGIDSGNYSTPVLVDIYNKGLPDILTGNSDGYIHLYRNRGTDSQPVFEASADAADFGSLGDHGSYSVPEFADMDGDKDLDLLVGKSDGTISYYENTGTPAYPRWQLITTNFGNINTGGRCSPRLVDIDSDGDPDMFAGLGDGTLSYYENLGDTSTDQWATPVTGYQTIDVTGDAVPGFVDIDRDNDFDLFIGNADGTIAFLENTGTAQTAAWSGIRYAFNSIDIGTASAPSFADFDGDGDDDLLVGKSDGTFSFFENTSAASLTVNEGSKNTRETTVSLELKAQDNFGISGYFISNSGSVPSSENSDWTAVDSTADLTVSELDHVLESGADGKRKIFAWFKDAAGNVSNTVFASILLERTPPVLTTPNIDIVNENSDKTDGLLTFRTDKGSHCRTDYGSSITYDSSGDESSDIFTTDHSFRLQNLSQRGTTFYQLSCTDRSGNRTTHTGLFTQVWGTVFNETWETSLSPYIITGNIMVTSGTLTIQSGVEVLFDGPYSIEIRDRLYARGDSSGDITFSSNRIEKNPEDWGGIVFNPNAESAVFDADDLFISGSILQNALIEFAGYNNSPAIKIEGTSPYISKNSIMNIANEGIHLVDSGPVIDGNMIVSTPQTAITTIDSRPVIKENRISDSLLTGISVQAGQPRIESNTIYGTDGHALLVNGGSPKIVSNTIHDNNGAGIALSSINSAVITANTISSNTGGNGFGILLSDGDALLKNNVITGNAQDGISVVGESEVAITANTEISANGGFGIKSDGRSTKIYNNTISENALGGIDCSDSPIIRYNTIINNEGNGITIQAGNPVIDTNNIWGQYNVLNGKYEVYNNSTSDVQLLNIWWNYTLPDYISSAVYDFEDDSSKGRLLVRNYLSDNWQTADFDKDGILDYQDFDDDNDGYTDLNETYQDYISNPFDALSVPSTRDSDIDGIADDLDRDDDNDGIPDSIEISNGMTTQNPDTDYDGVDDATEMNYGSDPGDSDSLAIKGDTLFDDTIWTLENSPLIIIGDFKIQGGITLTIEAGVEIRFDASDDGNIGTDTSSIEFIVNGFLNLNGTENDPVLFTSRNTVKSRGTWHGIRITPNSSGSSRVNGARIQYAKTGVQVTSSTVQIAESIIEESSVNGIDVTGDTSSVTVVDSTVRNNGMNGIVLSSGDNTIRNSKVIGNAQSGIVNESRMETDGNIISMNGSDGINDQSAYQSLISNNSITMNNRGILINQSGVAMVTVRNNIIASNADEGIALERYYAVINNNTIDRNRIGIKGNLYYDASAISYVEENIITGNKYGIYDLAADNDPYISYNDVWNNTVDYYQIDPSSLDTDSRFDPVFSRTVGRLTSAVSYDNALNISTLFDNSAGFTENSLVGRFIRPNINETETYFPIVANSATTISVEGYLDSVSSGDFYDIVDRYKPKQNSPALTANVYNEEIGAYGGGGNPALQVFPVSTNRTVAGSLQNDEIWCDSIDISADVTVPAGRNLTIWKGTDIRFLSLNSPGLFINGQIEIKGDAADRIQFTSDSETHSSWKGIVLKCNSKPCDIRHSLIEFAGTGIDVSPDSPGVPYDPKIEYSVISDNFSGMIISSATTVINSTIYNNQWGGIYVSDSTTYYPLIRNNLIVENFDSGIYLNNSRAVIEYNTIWANDPYGVRGDLFYQSGGTDYISVIRFNIFDSNGFYAVDDLSIATGEDPIFLFNNINDPEPCSSKTAGIDLPLGESNTCYATGFRNPEQWDFSLDLNGDLYRNVGSAIGAYGDGGAPALPE